MYCNPTFSTTQRNRCKWTLEVKYGTMSTTLMLFDIYTAKWAERSYGFYFYQYHIREYESEISKLLYGKVCDR